VLCESARMPIPRISATTHAARQRTSVYRCKRGGLRVVCSTSVSPQSPCGFMWQPACPREILVGFAVARIPAAQLHDTSSCKLCCHHESFAA
jgi:hypothetical protein